MQTNDNQTRTGKQSSDEASQLREQLSTLVKEVRCTIPSARAEGSADPVAGNAALMSVV